MAAKNTKFRKTISDMQVSPEKLQSKVDEVGLKHATFVIKQIKNYPPFENRSGKLSRGNKVVLESSSRLKFYNNVFYAPFLHDGTGLFGPKKSPIVPKNGAYLSFRIGNQWIRTKSVKGIKPMEWFPKNWEKNTPRLVHKMSTGLVKLYNPK